MRLSGNIIVLTFGIVLMSGVPLAAQDDCQPVFEAFDKVMSTPTHIYTTSESGGKSKTIETIYLGDDIFTNDKGSWAHSQITMAQVKKQEQENRRKATYSCKHVKDEPLDGEMALLFTTHSGVLGQTTDRRIWISRSNGLPLRNEEDDDTGGKGGKTHYTVRYEYKGVKPPRL